MPNEGDCWHACGEVDGPCPDWCGPTMLCCRTSWPGSSRQCGSGTLGCTQFHCCTTGSKPNPGGVNVSGVAPAFSQIGTGFCRGVGDKDTYSGSSWWWQMPTVESCAISCNVHADQMCAGFAFASTLSICVLYYDVPTLRTWTEILPAFSTPAM